MKNQETSGSNPNSALAKASDAVAEALRKKNEELTRGHLRLRVARLLGVLTHPVLIAGPVIVAIGIHEAPDVWWLAVVGLATVVATFGLPALFVFYLHKEGFIGQDVFFKQQENRKYVYLAIVLGLFADYWGFTYLVPFRVGAAMALSGIATAVLLFAINFATKVSFHAAGTACLFTMGLMLYGKEALVLIPLVPAAFWARVVARNHTVQQATLGVLIGFFAVLLTVLFAFPDQNRLTVQNWQGYKENPPVYWLPFTGRPATK